MQKSNRERKNEIKYRVILNEEQKEAKRVIRENQIVIITGRAGCLSKGTKVLSFDGTFKNVEDIKVGDKIMGVDSTPRTVLELKSGIEQMYWVRQKRGLDYRVNESHILSLMRVESEIYPRLTKNGKRYFDYTKPPLHNKKETIVNISILDFLNLKRKKQYKGYISKAIDFNKSAELLIDPYYLGLWLGDGTKNCIREITTGDFEIINYLVELGARKSGDKLKWVLPTNLDLNNAVKKYFGVENVSKIKEKLIPADYLFSSKENRLKLIAGILDSDGHYVLKGKYYDLTLKDKALAHQVVFISRSLGYKTNIRSKTASMKRLDGSIYTCEVWRISIIPIEEVPCLINRKKNKPTSDFKNRRLTGVSVEKDIIDNYYGFTLDGDNLFMLEDFTVTHNSGKSMVGAITALDFLFKKEYDEILVTRALVEVGRSMGFLPGSSDEKFNPYMEALVENLYQCVDGPNKIKVDNYIKDKVIKALPVQFVRGKTINQILIVEEGQNLTAGEMEALLTRLGKDGKIIINGDQAQRDTTAGETGLDFAIRLSKVIPEIKHIKLKHNHRSDLVGKILDHIYGV